MCFVMQVCKVFWYKPWHTQDMAIVSLVQKPEPALTEYTIQLVITLTFQRKGRFFYS
jgi:hypothetical protein